MVARRAADRQAPCGWVSPYSDFAGGAEVRRASLAKIGSDSATAAGRLGVEVCVQSDRARRPGSGGELKSKLQ